MDVIVYTTPSCMQCEMTKKVLDKGDVSYTTVDLSTDQKALEHVRELGYASAPVVEVTPTMHWSGFRNEALKNLINAVHSEVAKTREKVSA